MSPRRVCATVVLPVFALVATPAASAHARLVRSTPAPGAVLAVAPRVVHLYFDDRVRPLPGSEAIRNGGGSILARRPFQPDSRREVIIPLNADLPNGDYSIRWLVLSDDGHPEAGVLAFAVGLGRRPPESALSPGNTGPFPKDILSRWLFFIGLLLALGSGAFFLLILRPSLRRFALDEPATPFVLMFVGYVFAFLGSSGLAAYHHHSTVSRSGIAYAGGAMFASLGAVATVLRLVDRSLGLLPLPFAGLLLPIPTLAGHALDSGQAKLLSVVFDLIHVGATGVWLGGLVALAFVLRALNRTPNSQDCSTHIARRFSAVAVVSVALLSSSGVVRAVSELRSVTDLWSSGYGRALIVKTSLLTFALALGWYHRYRLVPRLGKVDPSASADLQRSVRLEVVLLLGALLAVAFLTDLAPGRELG